MIFRSYGIKSLAILCAYKVTICVLCFIQFVVYSMRNPVVYRTAKKISVLLTISVAM